MHVFGVKVGTTQKNISIAFVAGCYTIREVLLSFFIFSGVRADDFPILPGKPFDFDRKTLPDLCPSPTPWKGCVY